MYSSLPYLAVDSLTRGGELLCVTNLQAFTKDGDALGGKHAVPIVSRIICLFKYFCSWSLGECIGIRFLQIRVWFLVQLYAGLFTS